MEHLVKVVQDLSQAHTVEEVTDIVRIAARELTGADGAAFVLRDGDQCYYVEENAIGPLWKGKRFPMSACVSGWVMLHKESVVIEDIYKDPRIPQDAYRPTFVKSLAMVPIRKQNPIGAIGNYWAENRRPSEEEVNILQALADTTSVALENAKLYTDLKTNLSIIQEREARIHAQHDTLEIFTSALAHDLKEPARTIHAFTEMITQEKELSGKTADYFRHINQASGRMLSLIDTVFHYIQLDSPQTISKEYCNMGEVVQEVVDNLHQLIKDKNARIVFGELPDIHVNRIQMIQLLQNIISNAIYHNNNAPEVKVSAQMCEGSWLFAVEDNGIGIEGKDTKQIFTPFKRASSKSKGLGLGLAICERIMASHNGKIWFEPKPDKGVVFFFTIPASMEPSISKTEKVPEQKGDIYKNESLANLLIVDDMDADLDFTDALFERFNIVCNIFKARSGEEALEILRNKREQNAPIDIVLLDINMPQMDGFETLEKIRADKMLYDTNVIMCTGSTYGKDKKRAELLGANGYLLKPIKKDSLEVAITVIPSFHFRKTSNGYAIQSV